MERRACREQSVGRRRGAALPRAQAERREQRVHGAKEAQRCASFAAACEKAGRAAGQQERAIRNAHAKVVQRRVPALAVLLAVLPNIRRQVFQGWLRRAGCLRSSDFLHQLLNTSSEEL